VMHVEAGLRSFDREMPEEINRVITDHVSDYLMVSEPSGLANLKREGFPDNKMFMVGNIMIECLLRTRKHWEAIRLSPEMGSFYDQKPVVATFHRPENVDDPEALQRILGILRSFYKDQPVVFPVHPRTRSKLEQAGLFGQLLNEPNLLLTDPLSYFEFLKLVSNARLVITDSGGVQEETSFLNIPCVTFRKNTERPVTTIQGTNLLINIQDPDYFNKISSHKEQIARRAISVIPLWDDKVSSRITDVIHTFIGKQKKSIPK
jgi:UDP-N-acetylglucosamine 2-epimerase (non-hydrolysing)